MKDAEVVPVLNTFYIYKVCFFLVARDQEIVMGLEM